MLDDFSSSLYVNAWWQVVSIVTDLDALQGVKGRLVLEMILCLSLNDQCFSVNLHQSQLSLIALMAGEIPLIRLYLHGLEVLAGVKSFLKEYESLAPAHFLHLINTMEGNAAKVFTYHGVGLLVPYLLVLKNIGRCCEGAI